MALVVQTCSGTVEQSKAPQSVSGVVTYLIRADRCLVGQWVTVVDGHTDGQLGHEFATPLDCNGIGSPIAGTYHVELTDRAGTPVYSGTLQITPVGPSFRLWWTPSKVGEMKFEGVGLLSNGELAAAYWLAR
jgi:hypothetical protein